MIIRNHLREPILINVVNKDEVVDINDEDHYSLQRSAVDTPLTRVGHTTNAPLTRVGQRRSVIVQPKSSASVLANDDDILYFSNMAMTKIAQLQVQFAESDIVDLWDRTSDITKCNQFGKNDGVKCRDTENIWLKWYLPKHIIFEFYNSKTYVIILMFISIMIVISAIILLNGIVAIFH